MKLYHGTNAKYLKTILRDGIKPRGTSKGNWQHTVLSHPNAVYLTNAYALYYALMARKPGDKDGLIVEIDTAKLNPFALCPDEDFLAQISFRDGQFDRFGSDKRLMKVGGHYRDNLEGWEIAGNIEQAGKAARDERPIR